MINEIISMNGYGTYVWSAFSFTLISFGVLYAVIKVQLVKEKVKFNAKFVTLTSDKKQTAKTQETYREILRNTSIYKI
jgi:heme exporter protein D